MFLQHKRSFLDEDLRLKEELFRNFDISQIVSWDNIELWCAINGYSIDQDLVIFILSGSYFSDSLYKILLETITSSQSIDQYISNVKFVESIYKIYTPYILNKYGMLWKYGRIWLKILENSNQEYPFEPNDPKQNDQKRIRLCVELDKKFQYLMLQFYQKNKLSLNKTDQPFIQWLLKRTNSRSQKSQIFQKILVALEDDIAKQRNITVYLQ